MSGRQVQGSNVSNLTVFLTRLKGKSMKLFAVMLVSLLVFVACTPVLQDDPFVFATDAASVYKRVDRSAMPAVATAVITSKDAYNAANPVDDANLMFATEIVTNVNGLHEALDDDLTGLNLVPCNVNTTDPFNIETSTCINQAAPLVVPDTLKIDTTAAAGFPNGRQPADPVMDVTLAVVLLELGATGNGQNVTSLVGVLNPAENDKAFLGSFPYLAAPHAAN